MEIDMEEMIRRGLFFKPADTNQKFKTKLDETTLKRVVKQDLPETIRKSFKNQEYDTYETIAELVLYRVYGVPPSGNDGARQKGAFSTTEFAESRIDVKCRLSLDPQWKNALYIEEKLLIPKGVVLQVGAVGPVTLLSGTVLEGGADQILLPKDWPEDWVIGYRYVTSEPLMEYPTYSTEKPDEIRYKTISNS